MTERDVVQQHIRQWERERPDLSFGAMATFARLGRLAAVAGPMIAETFSRHELNIGEFDVLAALRRSGEPFVLTPSTLAKAMMLSTAAMTNRLDRLQAAGLVDRRLDPENRRSILVSLTAAGRTTVDAAVVEHVANEESLLAGLTAGQRQTLDDLLATLLASLEGPTRSDRPTL
ncbi:MarR family transcriptional regulator [Nakamurella silvestris]|nr:MarR family transcriptional regulator [Nakamurella silvestris]